jgi:hypothetical protein
MDKAERRKVEQAAIKTVLQEGIDFFVTVNKPNYLHKIKVLKSQYHFNIRPLVLGTLIRVSDIMVEMNLPETVSKDNWMTTGIGLMQKQTDRLLDIVALAIHNDKGPPNRRIKRILKNNATPEELLALITYVITQMDVSGFMKSIISVKGMSLIKEEESIASGA